MARNKYDIDEELEQEFNAQQMKRLLAYLKPHKKTLLQILVVLFITNMAGLITPLLMKLAIDTLIPNKQLSLLIVVSLAFLTLIIVGSLCMKYRIRYMSFIGNKVVADLRTDLFKHLQKLSFNYFDSRPHGKILVRVVNYVNSLSDLISNGLINLISDVFGFFVALGIMFFLNWKLALVVLIFLPITIMAVFALKNAQRLIMQQLSAKQSNMNAYIHESINGMKVTQSFTREEVNFNIFNELQDQYKKSWMDSRKLISLIWPIIKNISVISQVIMISVALIWLRDDISAGEIVAFLGYSGNFWLPLLNISDFYNQLVTASAYLERIYETIDTQPDIEDEKDAPVMPTIVGKVEFDHVTFGYEKDQKILDDVCLTVQPGETIALVGPTGAGKTTIVNLISRFYDVHAGRVLIDGKDVREVQLHSLRKQMGIMMQDTFIFSGTILDNIRYSRLDATKEMVMEAAKAVKAHEFIMEMEAGYDTQVNERGTRLSTGQRQLISFARALLADPKILILDEATSSIDTQTEQIIQESLNVLLKGRTSFVVAHRLSTIKRANRILVINDQNIEEAGTHEELMETKGHYYKLFQAQMKFLA